MISEIQKKTCDIKWRNINENHEKDIDRTIFSMLSWILKKNPFDERIERALSPLKQKYPTWEIGEHQDFTHYSCDPEITRTCPWSEEELYGLSTKDFIKRITSYEPKDCLDYSYDAIKDQIRKMIKKNIDWGINTLNYMKALLDDKSQQLFGQCCNFLIEVTVTVEQASTIVDILSSIKLSDEDRTKTFIQIYSNYIDDKSIRNETVLLDKIRSSVFHIWKEAPRNEVPTVKSGDYVITAINSSFGKIVEFYLNDLSKEQEVGQLTINRIPTRYLDFFNIVLQDKQISGILGRTVISMQFRWLAYWIPEWTKEKLCPCFNNEAEIGLWEGMLFNLQITPLVYEFVFPYFKNRIENKRYFTEYTIQYRFLDFYSKMLFIYVNNDDLFDKYLPDLFGYLHSEEQDCFVSAIEDILKNSSPEYNQELWNSKIKRFLELRKSHRPIPLCPKEIEEILNWSEYLDFAIDDFFDIIEQIETFCVSNDLRILLRIKTEPEVRKKFTAKQIARLLLLIVKKFDLSKMRILDEVREILSLNIFESQKDLQDEIRKIALEQRFDIY